MAWDMMVTAAIETTGRPQKDTPIHEALKLTRGGDLAQIILEEQLYTLRITRAGKLILTK